MPSPLFNVLFLMALIAPAAMYIIGVIVLMISIIVKHYRGTVRHRHVIEVLAH